MAVEITLLLPEDMIEHAKRFGGNHASGCKGGTSRCIGNDLANTWQSTGR